MAGEFSAIVNEVVTVLPDAKFGFATHDDYNYRSGADDFGSGVDKPFDLHQQITQCTVTVRRSDPAGS